MRGTSSPRPPVAATPARRDHKLDTACPQSPPCRRASSHADADAPPAARAGGKQANTRARSQAQFESWARVAAREQLAIDFACVCVEGPDVAQMFGRLFQFTNVRNFKLEGNPGFGARPAHSAPRSA